MQGTKIRLLAGGLLMMATAGYVQADALQPDPAWQQGTLSNGLQWQVLTTPQRPSDRVEIRLLVNTGSLAESTQQSGYSHAIPRIALTQSGGLDAAQARSLWQQLFSMCCTAILPSIHRMMSFYGKMAFSPSRPWKISRSR